MNESLTAKNAKAAKENKSLTAKDAKTAKENKSFTAKDAKEKYIHKPASGLMCSSRDLI